MKFGKVHDSTILDKLDLLLPKEPQESVNYLKSLPKESDLEIYIGAPAWGIKDWRGKIYPEKLKPEEYLANYAKSFNSIELNTTHYRLPEKSDIFNWLKDVDVNFKFCPKVTQSISHFSGLTNKAKVEEFFGRVSAFGENLGISFMQLHENFSSKRTADLVKFISFIPKNQNVSIELRHMDWFKDDGIFKYFRSKGISSVISDTAGKREVMHMNITSPTTVIRFVGNSLHATDYSRIDEWVLKIKEWSTTGLKEIYFFIHEPEELSCPEISDYMIKQLQKVGLSTSAEMQFIKNEELGFDI